MTTANKIDGLIFAVLMLALLVVVSLAVGNVEPPPEPTTTSYDALIVDSEGVAVHAVLTVENEDVLTLVTGDKWRFQRRMEEQE